MKDIFDSITDYILGIPILVVGIIAAVFIIRSLLDWLIEVAGGYFEIIYFVILLAAILYKMFQKY